jgi:hypothetical protein
VFDLARLVLAAANRYATIAAKYFSEGGTDVKGMDNLIH